MQRKNYKHWISIPDNRRCKPCKDNHGKIFNRDDVPQTDYRLHERCRCIIVWMQAIMAGNATNKEKNGADYWLKHYNELPDYYITKEDAEKLGWVSFIGNLDNVAPGKMVTMGEYKNKNGHLPVANGRFWYEADINYTGGYRKKSRIVFSNDGLIFVTHDHYKTFIEIV